MINKIKKIEYWKDRYRIVSEEKKQRLKEYQKNYQKTRKSLNIIRVSKTLILTGF